MKTVLFSLVTGMMLLAAPAVALDAGVYFDADGTVNCVTEVLPGEYGPGFVYVVITDVDAVCQQYGLGGWEGTVEITGPLTVLDWGLPAGAVNAITPPSFAVGFLAPLPLAPVGVLMDMTVSITGPEPIAFRLLAAPIPSIPVPYPVGACSCDLCELEPLYCPTGLDEYGEPNVCATINGTCVVAGGVETWGAIKAIYR